MLFSSGLAAVAFLAAEAAAHGAVTSYTIGGKAFDGYQGFSPASSPPTIQRQWPSYDPIMKVTDPKMRCNGGTQAALNATIAAGSEITANWKQWTHAQGSVMVWMYKCAGEFKSCDGASKAWFKIDQTGMTAPPLSGTSWGANIILKTLKYTSKIPAELAPGNYLIRHEIIALHQANTPQFYPECAQITVTGTGTKEPDASFMASIPGYAPQSDPGITVDTYAANGPTTYTCPGPAVWPAAAKKAREFTA